MFVERLLESEVRHDRKTEPADCQKTAAIDACGQP